MYLINRLACFFKEEEIFSIINLALFNTLICLNPIKPSLKLLKIFYDKSLAVTPNFEIFFENTNLFTKNKNIKTKKSAKKITSLTK